MVNVLKFLTLVSFHFLIKCCFSGIDFTKCLSESQTGKTLIRLLLQKQSDLGLSCVYRPFWQATSVQNIRTFTVLITFIMANNMFTVYSTAQFICFIKIIVTGKGF